MQKLEIVIYLSIIYLRITILNALRDPYGDYDGIQNSDSVPIGKFFSFSICPIYF